jgi:hypothetical protein
LELFGSVSFGIVWSSKQSLIVGQKTNEERIGKESSEQSTEVSKFESFRFEFQFTRDQRGCQKYRKDLESRRDRKELE